MEVHPDAELLRLWAEYEHLWRYITTAEGLSDDQCDALGCKITEIEFAIHDTPSHTLAGLAVKAKLAAEYAPPRDPDRRCLHDILTHLAEEVQRLARSRH